jgi:hypothetical protein
MAVAALAAPGTAAGKSDPAAFTLNPLPNSVLLDPKLFTVSVIASVIPKQNVSAMVNYGAQGDLDGDGYPEVVISGWDSAGASAEPLFVFSALKDKTIMVDARNLLGRNITYGTAILRIADVNRDGKSDLIVFGHNETPVEPTQNSFYISKAGGGFSVSNPKPLIAAHEGEVGDINGDGLPDFVTANFAVGTTGLKRGAYTIPPLNGGVGTLVLWLNKGDGMFKPLPLAWNRSFADVSSGKPYADWGGGSAAATGDFNGDGKVEIVAIDYPGSMNDWKRGDSWLISNIQLGDVTAFGKIAALPTPYFEKPKYDSMQSFKGAEKSHDVQVIVSDFNNDGMPDILVDSMIWISGEKFGAGITQFLENEGGLNFKDVTDKVLYNFWVGRSDGGHETQQFDVNGDGFADLVMPGESIGVPIAKHWSAGWDGTQYITKLASASNDILINTGAGKFVSVGREAMHTLSQGEEKIFKSLGPSVEPYNLVDQRMFPYMLPDGRIGFVAMQTAWSAQGKPSIYFFDFRSTQPISTGPGGIDPATQGAPGFNEAYYLTAYPAVAAAVTSGTWKSGLDEYLHHGQAAGNHPCALWKTNCKKKK